MSALEEVLHGIDRCLHRICDAKSALARALEALEEAGAPGRLGVLLGSRAPEAQHALTSATRAAEDVVLLHQVLIRLETHILAGRTALAGGAPTSVGGPPASEAASAPHRSPVRAPDGSRYPPEAAWSMDILPPRVHESTQGAKTIGYKDGQVLPWSSGIDDAWSGEVRTRLSAAGVPPLQAKRLSAHVELKVAVSMSEGEHSELVINHAPCGSQPHHALNGCHQFLARALPRGGTLTVHGTTQAGRPFTHTYRGWA